MRLVFASSEFHLVIILANLSKSSSKDPAEMVLNALVGRS